MNDGQYLIKKEEQINLHFSQMEADNFQLSILGTNSSQLPPDIYIWQKKDSIVSCRKTVHEDIHVQKERKVINDPLGQPTDPDGSNYRLILKLWNGRTDRQHVQK